MVRRGTQTRGAGAPDLLVVERRPSVPYASARWASEMSHRSTGFHLTGKPRLLQELRHAWVGGVSRPRASGTSDLPKYTSDLCTREAFFRRNCKICGYDMEIAEFAIALHVGRGSHQDPISLPLMFECPPQGTTRAKRACMHLGYRLPQRGA